MNKANKWIFAFFLTFLLFGCSAKQNQSMDYKETKSIVLDILKTDEGKKAIEEASTKNSTQLLQTTELQSTIEKSFNDPQNKEIYKEMFKNPKVAKSFAKAIEDEHKKLLKDVMQDPEYQQMMIKVLNDPKSQETLLRTMNTTTYQQQTMNVMKNALQSPVFRMEIIGLMVEAQKKMMEPEKKQEDQSEEEDDEKDSAESEN